MATAPGHHALRLRWLAPSTAHSTAPREEPAGVLGDLDTAYVAYPVVAALYALERQLDLAQDTAVAVEIRQQKVRCQVAIGLGPLVVRLAVDVNVGPLFREAEAQLIALVG